MVQSSQSTVDALRDKPATVAEYDTPANAAEKVSVCDGRHLLAALGACASWLEGHRAAVDALNVFPVPDGDTGTNMSMTLNAALREAESAPDASAGAIAERAAHGALMGARGNSGVILSQFLRGAAAALRGCHAVGPAELAAALAAAAEMARRAVSEPVEGTILTVATAAARAAGDAAARGDGMVAVLDAALEETRAAVARTPDQLPILKQAGVVDAGAQGYLLMLEGASRYVHRLPTRVEHPATALDAEHVAHVAHGDDYGYCTEFVVVGPALDVDGIRAAISALGDSTLVVGEESIVRVHVHTEDPGRVLSYAAPLGRLHRVKVESMQDQHDRFMARIEGSGLQPAAAGQDAATTVPSVPPPPAVPAAPAVPVAQALTGVVAIAPGEGLAAVFRSLGAGAVVMGGQTMNPSTQEMLAAVESLPQDAVLVLPNNGNVLLVADQARSLARKEVRVVPARTVPQGMAALVAYSPDADLATNAAAMDTALGQVRTGEITTAVRDAEIDGLAVRGGDVLGVLDSEPALVGPDRDRVALDLMERMGARDAEVLTLYYGREVAEPEARALAARARERYDGLEVEVVAGGQPHYPYIMSLE